MASDAQFSFNTKWGRIYADASTTVEQMMAHGMTEQDAEAMLAIAHAAVRRLDAKTTPEASRGE